MNDDDRSADDMAAKFAPGAEVIDIARGKRARLVASDDVPRNVLRFVRMGDLTVRPPDWLVRSHIESDSIVVVVGDPGTGKSFCLIDIAACIATGTPWHGNNVKDGPVLFIAGEGQSGITRRRMAWEIAHGIDLSTAPLFVSTAATRLTDEPAQVWLLAEIERFIADYGQPVLVIIDTLARNFGSGDENDTHDMNVAVLACDAMRTATGATVLIAHHSSHADKGRGRGSIALRAAADAEFLLTRSPDGIVEMAATKMKDAPLPAPMAFRFDSIDLGMTDSDGEPVTSAVLSPTTYTPSPKRSAGNGRNQVRALAILHTLYDRHRANVTASGRDPIAARVGTDEWQNACREALNRHQFRDAKEGLIKAGRIAIDGVFVVMRENRENLTPSPAREREGGENPPMGVLTHHTSPAVIGRDTDSAMSAPSGVSTLTGPEGNDTDAYNKDGDA